MKTENSFVITNAEHANRQANIKCTNICDAIFYLSFAEWLRVQESAFPEGSPGCAVDVYIGAKLSPGVDFLDIVQKRKNDPAYLVAFDSAKAFFLDNEMEIPDFNPPCSVSGETEYSPSAIKWKPGRLGIRRFDFRKGKGLEGKSSGKVFSFRAGYFTLQIV